jgi:chromosome segregation ATPase
MQRLIRSVAGLVILGVVVGLGFIDADAQTRRKRRAKRVTRPVISNPTITSTDETSATGEPRVLSTADETTTEAAPGVETTKRGKRRAATSEEDMQQTINALSNQVNRLTDKLTQMQGNDRSLLDMERLTRAEQRSESLRSQQLEAESKLADMQSQMDQIEYALKPENIERVTSGYGTTRPEDARDSRRRQLESEKTRLQVQIRILETSKTRLETAVVNSDAEVDMLRRRLQQHDAPTVVDSQPASPQKPE